MRNTLTKINSNIMIVYIITTPSRQYIKIGKTSDINLLNRLRVLQTSSPEKLEVVEALMICNSSANKIERELHLLCSSWRRSGEWFECCEECVKTLENKISILVRNTQVMQIHGAIDDSTNKHYKFNPIGLQNIYLKNL